MADYRYGNRNRSSSIFSDDDGRQEGWRGGGERWREHEPMGGHDDDRGFFAKAGDEVRSWFGDEEAERRREQDARRWEQEHGETGRYRGGGHEDQWSGGAPEGQDRSYRRSRMEGYGAQGSDYGRSGQGGVARRYEGGHYGSERDYGRAGGGWGDEQRSGGGSSFGGSPHDESYRRWRAQQIEALDREYDEYCRHRQQQFDQDFTSFRQGRSAQGSAGNSSGMGTHGMSAGATTTAAGDASAATASTGSSNSDAEGASGKAR